MAATTEGSGMPEGLCKKQTTARGKRKLTASSQAGDSGVHVCVHICIST